MVEKKEHYNTLVDVYGSLLTDHQKEIFCLYYQEDFSLQEIAENYNISRNAVFDNIKRVETLLDDYEDKLELIKKERNENKKKIMVQIVTSSINKEKIETKLKNFVSIILKDNVMIESNVSLNNLKALEVFLKKTCQNYELKIYKLEEVIKG